MQTLLMMLHVMIAIALIALVLVQQGKGSEMGAGFGAGASGTVFGARGSASFLVKLTGGLAVLFMATSITLTMYAARVSTRGATASGVTSRIATTETQQVPADVVVKTVDQVEDVASEDTATSEVETVTEESAENLDSSTSQLSEDGAEEDTAEDTAVDESEASEADELDQ
jgi:preprotein translocase subunit SecG